MSDNSTTQVAHASYMASPRFFFALVFILSIPFYILGVAGGRLPFATFLPVTAIMAFVPMLAALILVCRESGVPGAISFLSRAFDYRRIKSAGWLLGALLLMPIVTLLEFGVLRLAGRALPEVQFFSFGGMAAFALMFFVAAIGEELGWQGYAYARLKTGRSALAAALIIGVIWAIWHSIPFAEMGRSAAWIVWHSLSMVVLRIIIVWLFVNTGHSVIIASLFHATTNMPWGISPNYGDYYDPLVMFVILSFVAVSILALWGPATLARFRFAREPA